MSDTRAEAEKKAIEKWNAEADDYNQWHMISEEEQEELINDIEK